MDAYHSRSASLLSESLPDGGQGPRSLYPFGMRWFTFDDMTEWFSLVLVYFRLKCFTSSGQKINSDLNTTIDCVLWPERREFNLNQFGGERFRWISMKITIARAHKITVTEFWAQIYSTRTNLIVWHICECEMRRIRMHFFRRQH